MREELKVVIKKSIEEALGTGYEATIQTAEKNNGLVLTGVVVKEEGNLIAPTIFIDDVDYLDESELKSLTEYVVEMYQASKINSKTARDFVDNISKESILKNVVYQLINKEKNKKLVEEAAHKDFLDLMAIYRVRVEMEDGEGTFVLKNKLCSIYGISLDELDEAARENTKKNTGLVVKGLGQVMSEMSGAPCLDFEESMYVLGNESKINGASIMLYNEYLDEVAEKFDDDVYVLPSSIHELLVVSASDKEVEPLRDMVRMVNDTEVRDEEILSYNVYRYDRTERKLTIAEV